MRVYITGAAGMIGFHTAIKLKESGHDVVGIDNYNDYYDPNLKLARSDILKEYDVEVRKDDINHLNWRAIGDDCDAVIHLAAYANPRHAMEMPEPYIQSNIMGTSNILKGLEQSKTPCLYASSSCVMHGQPLPWNEHDKGGYQNNPYGWSKYVNECQFHHSNLPKSAGLRFFTVYGPYGRPDMALYGFTDKIVAGEEILAFNNGDMQRDFTYVDDIVQGVELVFNNMMDGQENQHEIFNIGYGQKGQRMDFIALIEKNLGRKAEINYQPFHPADTPITWSDTTKIKKLGYNPTTPIEVGVEKFINWYKEYHNVN